MKSTQNLPERLKEIRKKNKYSQEYVAEQLNISRQAISHWENGKSYPDIDNLILLADVFHISVDELLNEKIECDCEPEVEVPAEHEVTAEEENPEEAEVVDEEIVPEKTISPEEVEVHDKVEEPSTLMEILVLSIILILSANMSLIGIPVAIFIMIWSLYTKKNYKLVYILCVLCIAIGMHEVFILYTHFNELFVTTFLFPK